MMEPEYLIEKEFHFSASHRLGGLPDDHQCARLHGHNYILKVGLGSTKLDQVGFVLDYGELGFVKDIVDGLDHRHLNDIFSFNPTSENICRAYAQYIKSYLQGQEKYSHIDFVQVSLSETPKTWAKVHLYFDHMGDS